jgi:ankyrin repeat protein
LSALLSAMIAAQEGHQECQSFVLAQGAEVNRVGNVSPVIVEYVTAMHLLCIILLGGRQCVGGYVVISCLFNQDGSTALMIATQGGHQQCLLILLAHGADVDKSDRVRVVSC